MRIVFFLVELAAAFTFAFAMAVTAGFQGEYMRYSTPALKVLDGVLVVAVLAPVAFAVWWLVRPAHHIAPLARFGWWSLAFVVCIALAVGSLMAKEFVGPAMRKAQREKKRQELTVAIQNGDVAKSCELVNLAPDVPAETFATCRHYIEGLQDADARWRALAPFAESGSFRTWFDGTTTTSPVPSAEQAWFLSTFFSTMIAAKPGVAETKPLPSDGFEDLFYMGSLLRSLLYTDVYTSEARNAVREILPRIEDSYASRVSEAEKVAAGVGAKAEDIKLRVDWYRNAIADVRAP